MSTRPTIILHAHTALSAPVLQHLRRLLTERCGPCQIVQDRFTGARSDHTPTERTTYHLAGPWSIPAAEVHTHLIAAFSQLTP